MDLERLKNNRDFYTGYEDECEVVLSVTADEEYSLHVWDGYFEDIFGNPEMRDDGWTGFTRDYHEGTYTFFDDGNPEIISPEEYLQDMRKYVGRRLFYEETDECLDLLIGLFEYAVSINSTITVELNEMSLFDRAKAGY